MNKKKYNVMLTIFMIVLGFIFIMVGILREEPYSVYEKAIKICMECIGIG